MDLYVKRFHERVMDSCDPINEEVLVNVFLHCMVEEYHTFLRIVFSILFKSDGGG